MYWVDRNTGEIVYERDKNKPLWAYYEYLRGYGDGVIIESYIIGENPLCLIDFAYCVGDKYVNLKRDCHFKNHGVDNTYAPTENEEQEKIKVESIDTIVTMHGDKPYYENKYREVGDKCYHIGYSSYYLDVALEYKEKYFEVVERESDWIPCSERIPEEPKENPVFDGKSLELYLVTTKYGSSDQDKVYPFRAFWNGINFTDGWRILDVIAWMPLPEPYKGEGKDAE